MFNRKIEQEQDGRGDLNCWKENRRRTWNDEWGCMQFFVNIGTRFLCVKCWWCDNFIQHWSHLLIKERTERWRRVETGVESRWGESIVCLLFSIMSFCKEKLENKNLISERKQKMCQIRQKPSPHYIPHSKNVGKTLKATFTEKKSFIIVFLMHKGGLKMESGIHLYNDHQKEN